MSWRKFESAVKNAFRSVKKDVGHLELRIKELERTIEKGELHEKKKTKKEKKKRVKKKASKKKSKKKIEKKKKTKKRKSKR